MSQTTSRQRRAAKSSSSARAKIQRGSSSGTQTVTKKRRYDPSAPNYIIAGAIILIVGLGFAVGLAMSGGGPDNERNIALLIAPWVVAVGGLALSIYGFMHMKPEGKKASER